MSYEAGIHEEHRDRNHPAITPTDKFRGHYASRATGGMRDISRAAKVWAEVQRHKLLLIMERDDRNNRDEDPDTWD
ncbi:MAG: hypothetical protein WC880_05035 [Candidatus Paceibacterota bacterium]